MSGTEEPWRDTVRYWPLGWREHMRKMHRPYYFCIPGLVIGVAALLIGVFYSSRTELIVGAYVAIGSGGLLSVVTGTTKWSRRTVQRWRIREMSDARSALFAPVAPLVWRFRATMLSVGAVAAVLAPPLLGTIEGGSARGQARMEIILPLHHSLGSGWRVTSSFWC